MTLRYLNIHHHKLVTIIYNWSWCRTNICELQSWGRLRIIAFCVGLVYPIMCVWLLMADASSQICVGWTSIFRLKTVEKIVKNCDIYNGFSPSWGDTVTLPTINCTSLFIKFVYYIAIIVPSTFNLFVSRPIMHNEYAINILYYNLCFWNTHIGNVFRLPRSDQTLWDVSHCTT